MAMQNKLVCPKCGSERISTDDCYDYEVSSDYVVRQYCGHCMDCNVDVDWDEVYTFSHYENVRLAG